MKEDLTEADHPRPADPIVTALRMGLAEIAARRAVEKAERHGKMAAVHSERRPRLTFFRQTRRPPMRWHIVDYEAAEVMKARCGYASAVVLAEKTERPGESGAVCRLCSVRGQWRAHLEAIADRTP